MSTYAFAKCDTERVEGAFTRAKIILYFLK
ncbi:hypothetical protein SAMN06265376_1011010 [Dokdonia pacifica]|uniref:Uncharacterized protein n=1 Tax=Dokdonia pacifica TaxID=1627892 RepID=A0A238WET9_9FLAO|nr:hypothetical protein SAMN06265376_1011010 [Dokdonia pacifica]